MPTPGEREGYTPSSTSRSRSALRVRLSVAFSSAVVASVEVGVGVVDIACKRWRAWVSTLLARVWAGSGVGDGDGGSVRARRSRRGRLRWVNSCAWFLLASWSREGRKGGGGHFG